MQPSDTLCQGVKADLPSPGADSAPGELSSFRTLWMPEGAWPVTQHPLNFLLTLCLGDEGEGQIGCVSEKAEVISLKDLGEFFPPPRGELRRSVQLAAEDSAQDTHSLGLKQRQEPGD